MKAQMMKMAKAKNEKHFYSMFPNEQDFHNVFPQFKNGGNWIQNAHLEKGRCTPGSPNYDCPKNSPQWNLAQRFRTGDLSKKAEGGEQSAMTEDEAWQIMVQLKNTASPDEIAEQLTSDGYPVDADGVSEYLASPEAEQNRQLLAQNYSNEEETEPIDDVQEEGQEIETAKYGLSFHNGYKMGGSNKPCYNCGSKKMKKGGSITDGETSIDGVTKKINDYTQGFLKFNTQNAMVNNTMQNRNNDSMKNMFKKYGGDLKKYQGNRTGSETGVEERMLRYNETGEWHPEWGTVPFAPSKITSGKPYFSENNQNNNDFNDYNHYGNNYGNDWGFDVGTNGKKKYNTKQEWYDNQPLSLTNAQWRDYSNNNQNRQGQDDRIYGYHPQYGQGFGQRFNDVYGNPNNLVYSSNFEMPFVKKSVRKYNSGQPQYQTIRNSLANIFQQQGQQANQQLDDNQSEDVQHPLYDKAKSWFQKLMKGKSKNAMLTSDMDRILNQGMRNNQNPDSPDIESPYIPNERMNVPSVNFNNYQNLPQQPASSEDWFQNPNIKQQSQQYQNIMPNEATMKFYSDVYNRNANLSPQDYQGNPENNEYMDNPSRKQRKRMDITQPGWRKYGGGLKKYKNGDETFDMQNMQTINPWAVTQDNPYGNPMITNSGQMGYEDVQANQLMPQSQNYNPFEITETNKEVDYLGMANAAIGTMGAAKNILDQRTAYQKEMDYKKQQFAGGINSGIVSQQASNLAFGNYVPNTPLGPNFRPRNQSFQGASQWSKYGGSMNHGGDIRYLSDREIEQIMRDGGQVEYLD